MSDLLVDTNVFIYDLERSSQFHTDAVKILNSDNSLYTTSKNVSEYFAVLTKLKVDNNLIWKYYNDIKKNVKILFPAPGSLSIFEHLYNKYLPEGNRIYDLEVVSIMLYHEIPSLSTFNVRDFQNIDEIELYEIE
ncbi:MAG: PIN domain-containing protein [Candidatus Cloacimonetes bacterium]|nr:PIN domain-containing protein [Candidatus Cloacimonadota bacterium]